MPPGLLAVRRDQDSSQTLASCFGPRIAHRAPLATIVVDPKLERARGQIVRTRPSEHWTGRCYGRPVSYTNAKIAEVFGRGRANVNFNRTWSGLLQRPICGALDDKDVDTTRCACWRKSGKNPTQVRGSIQAVRPRTSQDLAARFDRYAILANWNFQNPTGCVFHIETHGASVAHSCRRRAAHQDNHFAPEDFEQFIGLRHPQ